MKLFLECLLKLSLPVRTVFTNKTVSDNGQEGRGQFRGKEGGGGGGRYVWSLEEISQRAKK